MINSHLISSILTVATEGGHGFDWVFVAEHLVNLIILVGVLVYLLRKPVTNYFSKRRKTLGKEMDEAEGDIAQAKQKHENYAQKLDRIEEEIRSLKESIRKQGQTEREGILKQAEITSQNIKRETEETIKLETDRARREIRSEVVSLALEQAKNLIEKNIEESDKKRFTQDFIQNIEEEQKWHQSRH